MKKLIDFYLENSNTTTVVVRGIKESLNEKKTKMKYKLL